MAALIYLDTHVAVWLYSGAVERIPTVAREAINASELLVSPMVVLELQYLFEIRRTSKPAREVVDALGSELGLAVCDQPFPKVANLALDQGWTRDPFDRFIVSQAALRDAPLLTKDQTIHQHYARALWSTASSR